MIIHITKCILVIKKMKILPLLFILMWSLMAQQNIYGKLSTHDIGFVKYVATAAAPAARQDSLSVYDIYATEEMIQENIAKIITTNDKNQAASSTSTVVETKTILTAGNKGQCNNAVAATTIYGHFNENDNNAHKLLQNVAKRDQQQSKVINMNKIRPASSQLTSSSSSSSSAATAVMSAEVIITSISQSPAESILLPKGQLNKKVLNNDSHGSRNKKIILNQAENAKEREMFKVKINDSRMRKLVYNDTSNSNNNYNKEFFIKNNLINVTKETDQRQKPNEKSGKEVMEEDGNNSSKSEFRNSGNSLTFASISQARQELILQFVLKWKQIPRVTYFTCKEKRHCYKQSKWSMDTIQLVGHLYKSTMPGIMFKVVLIDHLVKEDRRYSSTTKTSGRSSSIRDNAAKNFLSNTKWLEQTLRPDTLRQIVILDLNCGLSSRILLKMASNKAFFNSKYHWLLLEDYDEYIFNRQTEIDDADDIENKMNIHSYNTQTDKSFKEEIVNDSNTANLQVKKLSTYPKEVDGVFTSDSNPKSSPTSYFSLKMAADRKQQHRCLNDKTPFTTLNASRAGKTDENDMDVIEKFLEKLNININTELILAKRRVHFIATPANSSACCSTKTLVNNTTTTTTTTTSLPLPASKLTQPNSASMVTPDYNSLEKMDYYLLYDVWNAGRQYGGKLNITECGNFTRREGWKLDEWFDTTSTTRRRLNMHLARVRCMVVITHKNLSDTLEDYLTTHYDTHLDSMNRFNFALLTHVRDLFNFSFILSKTSTWGYLKNGKFDGMIGALVRKQADIGGSPIFFRIERAKVIDYTTRTWVARPCFIFRHPRSTTKDRIVFLQPFSNMVWILLFVSGCLTIILLWLLTSLEHKFNAKNFDKTKNEEIEKVKSSALQLNQKGSRVKKTKVGPLHKWLMLRFDQNKKKDLRRRQPFALFFESLIFYIGAICQQGLSFTTFFFSGRCIVITSLLFSFAIYQFYSASIVGTLLMEKSKTIRTLRDIIHSSMEIGIEDIVYNRDFFLRTKDPVAQELYAKKVSSVPLTEDTGFADTQKNYTILPTPLTNMTDAQKAKVFRDILHSHETGAHAKVTEASKWYDPDYGVTKIKQGGFAFHVDVATAYKIIADTFTEREICDLTEIQLFPPQKMVSIVQKGSPLRKAITYGLRRVTEVGLTDYQRKVWHSPKPRCVKQLHTDDLRVDMQTFTSALLVLIFGYAVSLLILGLEIVHFKLWQRYTTTLRI